MSENNGNSPPMVDLTGEVENMRRRNIASLRQNGLDEIDDQRAENIDEGVPCRKPSKIPCYMQKNFVRRQNIEGNVEQVGDLNMEGERDQPRNASTGSLQPENEDYLEYTNPRNMEEAKARWCRVLRLVDENYQAINRTGPLTASEVPIQRDEVDAAAAPQANIAQEYEETFYPRIPIGNAAEALEEEALEEEANIAQPDVEPLAEQQQKNDIENQDQPASPGTLYRLSLMGFGCVAASVLVYCWWYKNSISQEVPVPPTFTQTYFWDYIDNLI